MALLAFNDFDGPYRNYTEETYDTTDWSTNYGEGGSLGTRLGDNYGGKYLQVSIPSTTGVVCGFRSRVYDTGGYSDYCWMKDENGAVVAELQFISGTTLRLLDANATVIDSASIAMQNWNTCEWKINHGATGAYEVRVDGVAWMSGTGDFLASGTGIDIVGWGDTGAENGTELDGFYLTDYYVLSTTGDAPTDFTGRIRCEYLLPDGDGNTTAWTPDTGSTNYTQVNEDPIDTADYVQSGTLADIDLYTLANTAGGIDEAIIAVSPVPYTSLPDGGTRFIRPVIRQSATNYTPATSKSVPDGNGVQFFIPEDPATASAWTDAGVDSAEIGVEVRDS